MQRVCRTVGVAVVLFGVFGAVASACGSPVRHGPHGLIGVVGEHSKWRDGSDVTSGGLNYPTDIYVVGVAGGRVRNLTRDERSEYCWSWLRHGRGILFASVPSDRMKQGPTFIDVVSASGRQRRRLVSAPTATDGSPGEGYGVCPTLSPDGVHLVYVIESGRRSGLYVMRTDGTQKKRLTRSRNIASDASWSPDGRQILFVRESERGARSGHIYVINADRTGLRQLTKGRDSKPVWSFDGEKIAFIGGEGSLFTMRRDGTHVTRLTRANVSGDSEPAWMSDDRVVYQDDSGRWWTVAADEATAPPRPLPPSTRVGRNLLNRPGGQDSSDPPVYSPEGSWIGYWRWTPRGAALWISHEDGTERHLVSRFRCCYHLYLEWAPR